jgi:hypothetical protein
MKPIKTLRTRMTDLAPRPARALADDQLLAVAAGCSWLTEVSGGGTGYCKTDYPKVM